MALWSYYAGVGKVVAFVHINTLQEPYRLPPNIHIFTSTRQPWIVLSPAIPVVAEYYDRNEYWPATSLARRKALLAASHRPA